MVRKFIDIEPIKQVLLEKLTKKFLETEHFNADNININLPLQEMVEEIVQQKDLKDPKIYILDTAWLKIQKLVKEFNSEVAWHCLVERHTDNRFLIYDVLVFPQEVTGATANGIDGEYEMWLATLPDEQFEHCRCHMHSHVNMGVTPSSVDESYYADLMKHVKDFYITMIINKSHLYYLRFYDKENNIVYTDLAFSVCDRNGNTYDNWFDSVKDAVQEKKYTAPTYTPVVSNTKDKKKEKKTSTITTMTGETIGKTSEIMITNPAGEIVILEDMDKVVNYIYAHYSSKLTHATMKNFTREKIKEELETSDTILIDKYTLHIMDETEARAAYSYLYCDIWEVE